jgi:hypothetical protein
MGYQGLANPGADCARWKTSILGVLAGVYVALGACLSYAIAGEVDGVRSFSTAQILKSEVLPAQMLPGPGLGLHCVLELCCC